MKFHKRGIVLIGILVLTLVATFFVGALLQMNPTRLRRTVQDERHDHASAAAKAGIEYVLNRLADDPEWKGTANSETLRGDSLVVREDNGNVLGWVRAESGDWAGFRVRFNYQDGPGGADGLEQPAQPIPSQAISLNNLAGASPVGIPLGTGANFAFVDQRGFMVPEHSVALVCEGFVGPGIKPNGSAGPQQGGGGAGAESASSPTATRTVTGIYQITGFAQGMPEGAVLQVGGDSKFTLGAGPGPTGPTSDEDLRGYLRLMASDQTAVMRTKGRSTIETGAGKAAPFNFFPDMHSEVKVGQSGSFDPITKAGQDFTNGSESVNAALMEVEWNKVSQSAQDETLQIPAGVYAVSGGDTNSTDASRVKYYPMSFAEYRQTLVAGQQPASAPVPQAFMDRVELNGKDWTSPSGTVEKRDLITFDRDVDVTPVGNQNDLAIVPAAGARQKSVSDGTATVSASTFSGLHTGVKADTGEAILDYLFDHNGGAPVSFALGNQTFTYSGGGNLSGGSYHQVAQGVFNGETLTFSGSVPSGLIGTGPPQIQPINEVTNVSAPFALNLNGSAIAVSDTNSFLAAVHEATGDVPSAVLQTGVDPLEIPSLALTDNTEPQDLEIAFTPTGGKSAAIRGQGSVLLATHLSGKGGSVVAADNIDIVGLGIDMTANQGERDGVSLYAKGNVNISTYDQKRNKYWDASIKGVIYTKGNLTVRMGESLSGQGSEPEWGTFDFLGAAIAQGSATGIVVSTNSGYSTGGGSGTGGNGEKSLGDQDGQPQPPNGYSGATTPPIGNAELTARGIRLFYEPKFLAPFVNNAVKIPIFGTVSVVES